MRKRTEPEDDDALQSIESPWSHRLPNESPTAFAKFLTYRDLGVGRSFTSVAKSSNVSVSAIAQMALKNRWRDRVWAYDYYNQKQADEELARDRRAARERQIRLGMSLQAVGAHGLLELQQKLRDGILLNLTPREILALAECGAKLEREALGEEPDPHHLTKIVVVTESRADEPESTPPHPSKSRVN